ncbi:hypothetical protein MIFENG_22 [Hafnia phage vB_HpaM_Meifeng]|nr:hypothetical protein MIFENG_22 [Hafnia phage vB_HpaM_Meifeng]
MTSREQFEAIYMKREPEASMAFNENVGRYKYAFIQSQYEFFLEAWQASREAVEVELPAPEPDSGTDSQVDISAGFSNRMRSKCIESIRAAGIKVKGE